VFADQPQGSKLHVRRRWISGVAAAAAACITYAFATSISDRYGLGPVDDAYISLRYAANWAGGKGLCFNPGEHVEGYTNFLLVLIEAAAIRCGADPVLTMKALGWASLAVLAGVLATFAARHVFPERFVLSAAVGILAALNSVLVCWASSGLESCLYALLLLASMTVLVDSAKRSRTGLSAMFLVLAALTRPEAVALLPVMTAVVYLKHRSAKQVAKYACVFVVGFGLYFTARVIHFGHLFPNPFYAKLDYSNMLLVRRGVDYVWSFVCAVPVLFLWAVAGAALIRRAPLWVSAFTLVAAVELLTVVYEGGDHFAMFRFMVPVLPLITVLALYPSAAIIRRYGLSGVPAFLVALAGLAAIGVSDVMVNWQEKKYEFKPITQFDRFVLEARLAEQWAQTGRWLGRNAPQGASLTTAGIGAVGYFSELTIIDPHGVVDPVIAFQKRTLGRGPAGHEKHDSNYVLSRRPSYIGLMILFTADPVPRHEMGNAEWGQSSREMFLNPRLDREYRYESIPVGRRFLNLYIRRDLLTPSGVSAGLISERRGQHGAEHRGSAVPAVSSPRLQWFA
jgi:arabinofuranosyltransferase